MNPDLFRRRIVPFGSLAAAAVAVVVMAVWGMHSLTAPVASSTSTRTPSSGPTCPPEQQQIKEYVTRHEVTVSVYNTGKRTGRAGATLTMLENAGFRPGAVGNGARGDKVRRAEVRTTQAGDPGATLVAQALGRGTRIVVTDQDYGPGIDVFIGDKFGGLDKHAPHRVKLAQPIITCK